MNAEKFAPLKTIETKILASLNAGVYASDSPMPSLATIMDDIDDLASGEMRRNSSLVIDDADKQELLRRIEFQINIWVPDVAVMEDNRDHIDWLPEKLETIDWQFSDRYLDYLGKKLRNHQVALKSDITVREILKRLEDPDRPGYWDRRGLVVGDVQSGKTSNYIGLICRALDAGYKVIVVLAGMHNNLRSQTQVRIEEGILGVSTDPEQSGRQEVGVGLSHFPHPIINSVTTRVEQGDFKTAVANNFRIAPGQDPLIFVVKKNGTTLRNLLKWVQTSQTAIPSDTENMNIIPDVPLLLIDDEADQASPNTADVEDNPRRINSLIRQILRSFAKSSYVGYTATPFANVFIDDGASLDKEGQDIFPESFIVNVGSPSNYIGPSTLFGIERGESGEMIEKTGLDLVRSINDYETWMPRRHRMDWKPDLSGNGKVPDSLRRAVYSYILAGAAKEARGLVPKHHSMLIHVTRFQKVQSRTATQVKELLDEIRLYIGYGSHSESNPILKELEYMWESDFRPTTLKIDAQRDELYSELTWKAVHSHIKQLLEMIQIRTINGTVKDVLDYSNHEAHGLKVIAIGGDKLSRGLTLEGLSISYFLRASKMYDTLMQMGRWFGYRPDYLDLCRIYMSEDLEEWFTAISEASDELREEIKYMCDSGQTPKQYGLRVRTHPKLMVTSYVKMRSATKLRVNFSDTVSETTSFDYDRKKAYANDAAVENLLIELGQPSSNEDSKPIIWKNVAYSKVVDFFRSYRTREDAYKVASDKIAEFIERWAVEVGELTDWTVVVANKQTKTGDMPPQPIQNGSLCTVPAQRKVRISHRDEPSSRGLTMKRLFDPQHEVLDLTQEQYDLALELTLLDYSRDSELFKHKPTTPSGKNVRKVRNPLNGLLVLYLVNPTLDADEKDNKRYDIDQLDAFGTFWGFAVSLPKGERTEPIEYQVNRVYMKQIYDLGDENE